MIEYLLAEMCDSALPVELVEPLVMENGMLKLTEKPGLGIELNIDAVNKYEVKQYHTV